MNLAAASSSESALLHAIFQLVTIIVSARIAGVLFRRMGQPAVCGEIAAGLIQGPSFFGRVAPSVSHVLFDPAIAPVFSILSQLGLILMMFLVGTEFDFKHLKGNGRTAVSVSMAGILLPFILGFALGGVMFTKLGLIGDWINFSLFIATAMSITAIPVLARIMIEMNITRTRVGSLTISAAAMDDAIGWTILALVTAIVRSNFEVMRLLTMIAEVIAFCAFMIFVVRPLAGRWCAWTLRRNDGELSLNALAGLMTMIFLAAAITSWIGIFALFGGFLMGAILYDQAEMRAAVRRRLNDFVTAFFLPIFFTYTGLRTDVGSMAGTTMWVFCGLVLLCAVVGKFGGCSIAARLNGVSGRDASIMGVLMNTRGLMELIVINVGYELGILPKPVFFMLVFMAIGTTYMTAPILRRLFRGSDVWEAYKASGFAAIRG